MPWIRQVPLEEATGLLRHEYDQAMKRAGRIWNIVGIMSVNPRVLKASMDHYGAIMFGESPLTRAQREMIATVVAATLKCHY
jgi:alkylhydroperoxidase family enzyme